MTAGPVGCASLPASTRTTAHALPGAQVGAGLAVRGEEVAESAGDVDQWIAEVGLA